MRNEFIKKLKYNISTITRRNNTISQIEPNRNSGINLINQENANEIIDKIVEEPLRKVCKDLKNKGIETVMSSANRSNLLQKGEKALEKEDVKGKELFLDAPTYESAGKGYAWVMLNYNSLSDENKEELFKIEESKDSKGENIGEKIIWFVHRNYFTNIFEREENNKEKNDLDKKFKECSFVLQYNYDKYPIEVVFLRMPINDKTTVIDVEKYFEKLTEKLNNQQIEKSNYSLDRSFEK